MKHITRLYAREHPDTFFIYADDRTQRAIEGQAEELRNLDNSAALYTRLWNCTAPEAQFKDYQFDVLFKRAIDDNVALVKARSQGYSKILVLPKIGRGCSRMSVIAPKCYQYLIEQIRKEFDKDYDK